MGGTRRWLRLGLAAASLGMATVAAPLASPGIGTAAHAGPDVQGAMAGASETSRACTAGHDAGSGAVVALCVYDDAVGNRFGRITFRSPRVSSNVHDLSAALYQCQAGPKNCSLVAYASAADPYLPANRSMTVSTSRVRARYGWAYQACGGVSAEQLSTPPQYEFDWNGCTPFIGGAPRVDVIIGR